MYATNKCEHCGKCDECFHTIKKAYNNKVEINKLRKDLYKELGDFDVFLYTITTPVSIDVKFLENKEIFLSAQKLLIEKLQETYEAILNMKKELGTRNLLKGKLKS